jgi:hypothetical protein
MSDVIDRNCLSYWFPRLQAAGVPVPRTEIVRTTCDLTLLLDGQVPEGWGAFLADLAVAIGRLTDNASPTPSLFLRTGQGSGKHDWKRTCYLDLAARDAIAAHVAALVEWSHLVDFFGLAHDVWCIREMLPVQPVVVLPRYGDMPLVKEVRCFVRGGRVVCSHSYWPLGAIRDGLDPAEAHLAATYAGLLDCDPTDYYAWSELAQKVATTFADDGAWSVDLLSTRRGWVVTDMAEAHRSYHAPECAHAKAFINGGRHDG